MSRNFPTYFKALILGICGVILFSLKAVLAKLIYVYEVDAVSLLMLRMVFSLPFYIIILIIDHQRNPLEEKPTKLDFTRLIFFGLMGYYLASLLDFMGLQYIKAGLERIILFIYPTIVLILSWLFLKRPPNGKQVLAIFITYVGVLICFQGELTSSFESKEVVKGTLLIFLCAISFAAYVVGTEYQIPKFGAIKFTGFAMLFATVAVIIHYAIFSKVSPFDFHPLVYLYSLIMAIFCTVLPSFLVSASIKEIGANNFGIIAALGPITTIILAFIILQETLTYIQLAGAIIVIGGVFLVGKK